MARADFLQQQRQIVTGVAAHPQEEGKYGDMPDPLRPQCFSGSGQVGRGQFQKGTNYRKFRLVGADAPGHRLHGLLPERVARAVGKQDNSAPAMGSGAGGDRGVREGHRRKTSQVNALSDSTE